MNVSDGTNTSSPAPMPHACTASCNAAVPVFGTDVTVANPRMDKVYDRTTVGSVVPAQAIPTAPRRSAAPFVLALIALLAALAGLGYLLAKQLSGNGGGGSLVAVGNYVGQPVHDAELLIENSGLKPDTTTDVNDQVPAGQVVSQDPQAGNKLRKGDTVKLKASAGKGQVKVPDVIGASLSSGRPAAPAAGGTRRPRRAACRSRPPRTAPRRDLSSR